jgi:signal transduction histidine kinase
MDASSRRTRDRRIANEQAALRRVAVLVAGGAPPEEVFAAWGAVGRAAGYRSSVGVPISVESRLWGVIGVASTRDESLPTDIEARLAGFTELAATAVANAQARTELRGFAEEQAALRRVATLVARATPPEEIFTAVPEEAGRLLNVDYTVVSRYDADGLVTVVGGWARTDPGRPLAIGLRLKPQGRNIHALVFQTGQPTRIDDYGTASGAFADVARDWQYRSSVGVPISVEDRLWGVMSVASTREEPLSVDTKGRLAAFTELIVTALVNAEAQAALNASRARIVAAADRTRRRIERDLHDGAQQRLVSLALHLRQTQEAAPGAGELAGRLAGHVGEVTEVMEELREIARGIHPAILTEGGLRPALEALARRSAVPVSLDINGAERLPEPVEIAAYYAVAEALTNTAKHAQASGAEVEVAADGGGLRICVRDDGRGGADFAGGSGLAGIKDRMEALGGWIWLQSPPGAGTAVQIVIPLSGPGAPGPPAGAASSPQ